MPLLIISANQRRVNIVEGGIGKWWQMQAASRLLVGRHSILYHPFMCIWTTFLLHTFMFLFRPRIFTYFHSPQPHALALSPMSSSAIGVLCASLCQSVRCPHSSCRARPQPCRCQLMHGIEKCTQIWMLNHVEVSGWHVQPCSSFAETCWNFFLTASFCETWKMSMSATWVSGKSNDSGGVATMHPPQKSHAMCFDLLGWLAEYLHQLGKGITVPPDARLPITESDGTYNLLCALSPYQAIEFARAGACLNTKIHKCSDYASA